MILICKRALAAFPFLGFETAHVRSVVLASHSRLDVEYTAGKGKCGHGHPRDAEAPHITYARPGLRCLVGPGTEHDARHKNEGSCSTLIIGTETNHRAAAKKQHSYDDHDHGARDDRMLIVLGMPQGCAGVVGRS